MLEIIYSVIHHNMPNATIYLSAENEVHTAPCLRTKVESSRGLSLTPHLVNCVRITKRVSLPHCTGLGMTLR